MIADGTGGVRAAHPRTRIHALVAHARQRVGTVGVDGALGFALHVGVALQARQAGAGGRPVAIPTLSIDAAGRGPAGVNDLWSGTCRCTGVPSYLYRTTIATLYFKPLWEGKEIFCLFRKKELFHERNTT